jgi:segregation and condensation protein A
MPALANAPSVKTAVYEGPLDLLLELIEKRKLLINDISLSTVADDYIARVNAMAELPVGEAAEFVALAATLLLIKSRSLLPSLTLSPEESRDIKQLEYRLAVYQILKDATRGLESVWGTTVLYEGSAPEPEPLFIFDTSITLLSLRAAAQSLIEGFPQMNTLPTTAVKKMISLEEVIATLATRISNAFQLSFHEFSKTNAGNAANKEARHGIIVSFLALLELVKQGIIRAHQGEDFGDIMLEQEVPSVPRYD